MLGYSLIWLIQGEAFSSKLLSLRTPMELLCRTTIYHHSSCPRVTYSKFSIGPDQSTSHGSLFLVPTRPDPFRIRWPVFIPTRPAIAFDKKSDPTRPDPFDPTISPYCYLYFMWIIGYYVHYLIMYILNIVAINTNLIFDAVFDRWHIEFRPS